MDKKALKDFNAIDWILAITMLIFVVLFFACAFGGAVALGVLFLNWYFNAHIVFTAALCWKVFVTLVLVRILWKLSEHK